MDIHALFVQLPISFLFVYSVIEIIAYGTPALRKQPWLFPVSCFFLFVGVIGAFAALTNVENPLAIGTLVLYLILACAYLVRALDDKGWKYRMMGFARPFIRVWNMKKYFAHLVLDTWMLPIIAILALLGICATQLS